MPKISKKKESKNSKSKPSINRCKKGKRVERALVHLLKSVGIEDAERSEQHEGKGDGSDVRAKSLSMFHIESKGERSPKILPSTLKRWTEQLDRDCPEGSIPILFHQANNTPWMAFVFPSFMGALYAFEYCYTVHPIVEKSFEAYELWSKANKEVNLRERSQRDEFGDHFPEGLIKFSCLITDYNDKLIYILPGITAAKLLKKISDGWNAKTFPSECNASETALQSSSLSLLSQPESRNLALTNGPIQTLPYGSVDQ